MSMIKFNPLALSMALLSTLAVATHGQNSNDSNRNNSDSSSSRSQNARSDSSDKSSDQREGQSSRNQQSNQNSNKNSDQGSSYALVPEGWITVGVDSNNDGFYDTFETIYEYDLVKAREASKGRSGQSDQNRQSNQQQSQSQGMKKARIQGEIASLNTEDSKDSSGQRLIAQVKNSQGRTAKVCLGPKDKLSKLNLEKGDTITAEGVLARKDGKTVLLAAKVSANDQTVSHKLTNRQGISQMQGTVESLDEARSRRGDGNYLIAKVKTDGGSKQVHLGPKNQLSSLDLSEGDDISVLTRKGKVSGKEATIALRVSANGETVKVVPPKQMNQAKGQQDRNNR